MCANSFHNDAHAIFNGAISPASQSIGLLHIRRILYKLEYAMAGDGASQRNSISINNICRK